MLSCHSNCQFYTSLVCVCVCGGGGGGGYLAVN